MLSGISFTIQKIRIWKSLNSNQLQFFALPVVTYPRISSYKSTYY